MYSALGKIRKLLVFDSETYKLEKNKVERPSLGNLTQKFFKFKHIEELLFRKKIELYISYYSYSNYKFEVPDKTTHPLVKFIESSESIATKWVQDSIIIVPKIDGEKIYFGAKLGKGSQAKVLNPKHIDSLVAANIISTPDYYSFVCEGGNALRGKYLQDDYILIGSFEYCIDDTLKLADFFNVKKDYILRCSFSNEEISRLLFHIDMYLTIVGPSKLRFFRNAELVLYAEPMGGSSFENLLRENMNEMLFELSKNTSVAFTFVAIPLLVLNASDENPIILSYNNCHVENYYDENGIHRIGIHFPDYRSSLRKYANETKQNQAQINELKTSITNTLYDINKSRKSIGEFYTEDNKTPIKEGLLDTAKQYSGQQVQEFIDSLMEDASELIKISENRIRNMCNNLGFDEVNFIDMDFFESSKSRHGSLHCMSLVVERTPFRM